jgi:hypothetical protein
MRWKGALPGDAVCGIRGFVFPYPRGSAAVRVMVAHGPGLFRTINRIRASGDIREKMMEKKGGKFSSRMNSNLSRDFRKRAWIPHRQGEPECCPRSRAFRLRPNLPAMHLDDALHDGKADPGAWRLRVQFLEEVEDPA